MKMAALNKIFLLALVLVAAAANASDVADEFEHLKAEVFGPEGDEFYGGPLEQNYDRMLELLETGKVPPEVQGKITVDFMNALDTVCGSTETTNLDDAIAKLEQVAKDCVVPKFHDYLWSCFYGRLEDNAPDIYKKTSEKLSSLKENDLNTLNKILQVVYDEADKQDVSPAELDYSKILADALKDDSSTKVADVHRICATFLESLDPKVDLYPYQTYVTLSKEPMEQLMLWRGHKENCQFIMSQWEDIMKKVDATQ